MAVVKNPLESRLKKLEAELKALKKVKRPQDGIKVKPELLAAARRPIRAAKHRVADSSIFHPYAGFPREAMPPEAADRMTMAVDSAGFGFGGGGGGGFGQQALWSAYAEGQEFLGYPTLALMAQRGEYRTIVRTLASAMTRKWIRIKSGKDDGSSQPKINQLDNFMKKLRVRQHFKRAAELDFYFGRGHLFLEFGGTKVGTDPAETQHSVGWGDDEVTRDKVGKQCRLTAIRPVEPVWTYPMSYNTNDPLSPNWYKPEDWFVMG
jgi:hypothetical protein